MKRNTTATAIANIKIIPYRSVLGACLSHDPMKSNMEKPISAAKLIVDRRGSLIRLFFSKDSVFLSSSPVMV
jgi:membrane carboxypeptidase/penicillin-binding protein PbpC